MILNRWSSHRRDLSSAEVDRHFATAAHEILLFGFRTDRMEVGRHGGNFSVKLVASGAEEYRFGRRRVVLEPGYLLLVDEGEEYSSSIRVAGTRAVSVFLPRTVIGALPPVSAAPGAAPASRPLPASSPSPEASILSVPFRPGPATRRIAQRIARAVLQVQPPSRRAEFGPDEIEQELLGLTCLAIGENRALVASPSWTTGRSARSARLELLRRLLRARELLEDSHGAASLEQMAQVACLSKFHFLRAFASAFGTTPARFHRLQRLRRGMRALQAGQAVGVAAQAAGYRSASTFLRAVRARCAGRAN